MLKEYFIAIDRSVATAMRHCIYAEYNKIFNFALPDEKIKLLNRCTEEYLLTATDHNFKTLPFYKAIGRESDGNVAQAFDDHFPIEPEYLL